MLDIRNQGSKLKPDRPLLAIDFDDVLFDCNATLQLIIRDEFNNESSYIEFVTKHPHTKKEIFHFLYGSYHQNGAAMYGARNVLSRLVNSHRLIVVTGRSESTRKLTEEWLGNNFPTLFSEVYFTNTFLSAHGEIERRKSAICADARVDILIDDSLEEALEVSSIGIPVILFDRPWNRSSTPNMICRAKDWDHVFHKLSNKGGRNAI